MDALAPGRGRVAGKTYVIVGGTTGIGLSAAKKLAAEGGKLVVVGRNSKTAEEARRALGDAAEVVVGDAADRGTVEQAISTALARHGSFDGLYHVAGGSARELGDGPLDQMTDEGWQAALRLNLDSVFYSNRAAVRALLERGKGGVILNMSSVLGFDPSAEFFCTHGYAAAKAAIIGMSRAAAARYARDGVRINIIAPALVATPMSARAQQDDAVMEFIRTKQPLDGGRIGCPEDLDSAAVFLLSDESKFMTGQTVIIDGGWTITDGQYPAAAGEEGE